jgi:hypothetical protein
LDAFGEEDVEFMRLWTIGPGGQYRVRGLEGGGLPIAVCLRRTKSFDAVVWFGGGEGPGGEVAYVPGWFCE